MYDLEVEYDRAMDVKYRPVKTYSGVREDF